jgi:hypothetical protein
MNDLALICILKADFFRYANYKTKRVERNSAVLRRLGGRRRITLS